MPTPPFGMSPESQKIIDELSKCAWSDMPVTIHPRDYSTRLKETVPVWLCDAKPLLAQIEPTEENSSILKSLRVFVLKTTSGRFHLASVDNPKTLKEVAEKIDASRLASSDIHVPTPDGLALMPFQRAGIAYAESRTGVLFGDEMGLGKGFAKDHVLPTIDGMGLKMDNIKVGDSVIGSDGKATKVTGVYRRGLQEMYRIHFWDGASIECDGDHLWNVADSNSSRRVKVGGDYYRTQDTRTIFNRIANGAALTLPLPSPIHYQEKTFEISPYVMGVILAEGYIGLKASSVVVSIGDKDIDIMGRVLAEASVGCVRKKDGCHAVSLLGAIQKVTKYGLRKLSADKFIPHDYMTGSIQQRTDLLHGIMDGDGSVSRNRVSLSTRSLRLAQDVKLLVSSLGGIAKINRYERDRGVDFQVNVKMNLCPFWCHRKASGWRVPAKAHGPTRSIVSVERLSERQETICIKVEAEDSLFVAGVDHILTHNTLQAIGLCNLDKRIKTVLLIVPAYLKLNWKNEILKWDVKGSRVVVLNAKDPVPRITDEPCYYIINHEILARYENIANYVWDAIIMDEAHFIKGMDAQRTKRAHALKSKYRRMALTGTPALNAPIELYPILTFIDPRGVMTKSKFEQKFCVVEKDGFSRKLGKGCSNPMQLQQYLRSNWMVRRLKSQVLKELPAKQRQLIELPPAGDIKMILDAERGIWEPHEDTLAKLRMSRDEAELAGNDDEFMSIGDAIGKQITIAFAELAALRKQLALLKVPLIVSHIKDAASGNNSKFIVFFYHKEPSRDFARQMQSMGAVQIDGDTPMAERQAKVEEFQNSPMCRVIVGTIGSMGTGVTLTASSTVVMAELDWRPGLLVQAEDRAHRIGQKDSVLCQYFLFENSADSKMITEIIRKMDMISGFLDGQTRTVNLTGKKRERKPRSSNWEEDINKLRAANMKAIAEGLRMMAGLDADMARTVNKVGFSKFDAGIGHRLAAKDSLTKREAAFAKHLLQKYHRQLPAILLERMSAG